MKTKRVILCISNSYYITDALGSNINWLKISIICAHIYMCTGITLKKGSKNTRAGKNVLFQYFMVKIIFKVL